MTLTSSRNRLDPSQLDAEELKSLVRFLSSAGTPALIDEHGGRIELPKPVFATLPQNVINKLNAIARSRNMELIDLLLKLGTPLPQFVSHLIDDLGLDA